MGEGGLRGTGSMGTISGSFMQNELIDGLFRRDSMTALGSGAGAAVGRRGSGGGGGLSPHVLGSKSSVGCESECGVLDGSNAGNSSSSSGEMFGESLIEGEEDRGKDETGLSARVV